MEEWKTEKFRSTHCARASLPLLYLCFTGGGAVTGLPLQSWSGWRCTGGPSQRIRIMQNVVHCPLAWLPLQDLGGVADLSLLFQSTSLHPVGLLGTVLLLDFYRLTLQRVCSLWEFSIHAYRCSFGKLGTVTF